MARPIVHWEIGAKDAKRLQEFYIRLFDWDIGGEPGMEYALVQASEGGIGGGIFQTQQGMPAYLTIYVQVDDLQAYLNRAESLGGTTVVPPTPIPNVGSFALFHDPEGNLVGLFKG